MAYVRWRPRMVRQSVVEDVKAALTTAGWMGSAVMAMADPAVRVVDYFPDNAMHQGEAPQPNTLAVDNGMPGDLSEGEIGGYFLQPYRFEMAFLGANDAIAQAMLSDLADRYWGFTQSPFIQLYDYNGPAPVEIVRMRVEAFTYVKAPIDVAPAEKHLFYAELIITDFVDQAREPL